MTVVKRFLLLHAFWTAAITALVVPLSLATAHGLAPAQYVRWFAHSAALATFPAGLVLGGEVFRTRVWRNVAMLSAIQLFIMFFVFALLGFAAPMDGENVIFAMQRLSETPGASWLLRNQLAWSVYMTVAECISVPIYAGLGIMMGAWAEQVMSVNYRRLLFWALSLMLVAFTYLITENSYEMLVIKTNGPAAFSAFFMLLIPFGMYAGLLLPSIALARRAHAA